MKSHVREAIYKNVVNSFMNKVPFEDGTRLDFTEFGWNVVNDNAKGVKTKNWYIDKNDIVHAIGEYNGKTYEGTGNNLKECLDNIVKNLT